LSHQ
jgi:hypothetical protein